MENEFSFLKNKVTFIFSKHQANFKTYANFETKSILNQTFKKQFISKNHNILSLLEIMKKMTKTQLFLKTVCVCVSIYMLGYLLKMEV